MPKPAELFAIGQDLGGTNIVTAAYSSLRGILIRSKIPSLVQEGQRSVLTRMAHEARKVRALSGLPLRRFKALGIGSPGPLDSERGLVLATPNLKGWRKVPVAARLGRATGLKAWLDNDARCAALGEFRRGAGRGAKDLVILTLGTGVGGGIIVGGRLIGGRTHTAGELGWSYLDPRGPRLEFGLPGSVESFASASAIARMARAGATARRRGALWRLCQGRPQRITAKMAHQALKLGDASAKAAWAKAGWALGVAIASYINALNPEKVVLAGGVMAGGGRELLAIARRWAKAGAYPQPYNACRILAAELGDDASVIGAAEMALARSAA